MTDVIGVGALNRYVKSVLDSDGFLSDLALRGEVSGFVNHVKSGHWYFTLKDEKASVKAVMFRQEARRLGFVPQPGQPLRSHRLFSGLCAGPFSRRTGRGTTGV